MHRPNIISPLKLRALFSIVLGSSVLIAGEAYAKSSSYSLSTYEQQPAVERVDPYSRGNSGKDIYAESGQRAINETKFRLARSYSYNGRATVKIAVKPTKNLVDGIDSFTPLFSRTGSMASSNKLTLMTEGTSILPVSFAEGFCDQREPNVKFYVLESELSHYDQYINNKTVGPATTLEDGNYVADKSTGSDVSRDSFYLFGRLVPCNIEERQIVENLKIEVQSTETEQSVLVFAQILGILLRSNEVKSPGLNNAALIAQDALLSTLMLKYAETQSPNNLYDKYMAPAPRSSSRVLRPKSTITDEVISTAVKFRYSKGNYFPRSTKRKFRCSFKKIKKCNLEFDMPRRGKIDEMERYMQLAAEQGGATLVSVNCSGNKRRKIICNLKENLQHFTAKGFKKGLFSL